MNKNLTEARKIKFSLLKEGGTISYLVRKDVDFIILTATLAMYSKLIFSNKTSIAFSIGKPLKAGYGFPKKNDGGLMRAINNYTDTEKFKPDSPVNQIFNRYFGVSFIEFTNLYLFIK